MWLHNCSTTNEIQVHSPQKSVPPLELDAGIPAADIDVDMLWDGLEDLLYEEQRLESGRVQGICLRGVFIISICQRNHGIQTEFEGINRTLLRIRATKMQTTSVSILPCIGLFFFYSPMLSLLKSSSSLPTFMDGFGKRNTSVLVITNILSRDMRLKLVLHNIHRPLRLGKFGASTTS